MSNLLTSGVTLSLITASSYAKTAAAPMSMASREMKKTDPNFDLINRTMSYGTKELSKADSATKKAQEELQKAQEIARAEDKAEKDAKLEQAIAESKLTKDQLSEVASTDSINTVDKVVDGEIEVSASNATESIKQDTVELSKEVKLKIANTNSVSVSVDVPKVHTESNVEIRKSKLDILV